MNENKNNTQEEKEELVEFTDLDYINKAISLIGMVVTGSEDEELVLMLENATHVLVSATDYLSRKENENNE